MKTLDNLLTEIPNFESNMQKEEELFDQLENGDLSQEEYSNQMDELWNQ
ncbi:hypothetical protein [Mammaliicoccus sciuri]